MNLFQLSANYQKLLNELLECKEITPAQEEQLIGANEDLENKVLNYTSIIKTLEANIKAIKEQIELMEKRASSFIKHVDRMKQAIKTEMIACDKKCIENPLHIVKLVNNNPKVDYLDKTLIPNEFLRRKEIIIPATSDILKALKENVAIPGARLVRDIRVQIR